MKLIEKEPLVAVIERWIKLLTKEKNQEGKDNGWVNISQDKINNSKWNK